MTLNELIERLEELRDYYEVPGDTEIKGAFQPNYPLIAGLSGVTTFVEDETKKARIFIALGAGRDYGNSEMWEDDIITEWATADN